MRLILLNRLARRLTREFHLLASGGAARMRPAHLAEASNEGPKVGSGIPERLALASLAVLFVALAALTV